jgi:hypothetical protein
MTPNFEKNERKHVAGKQHARLLHLLSCVGGARFGLALASDVERQPACNGVTLESPGFLTGQQGWKMRPIVASSLVLRRIKKAGENSCQRNSIRRVSFCPVQRLLYAPEYIGQPVPTAGHSRRTVCSELSISCIVGFLQTSQITSALWSAADKLF